MVFMKVGLLSLNYPPYTCGGIETYVELIAKEFANQKTDVTIISSWSGSQISLERQGSYIRIVRFPIPNKPIHSVWFQLFYGRNILHLIQNLDIVHANAGQTSALAQKISKIKPLITTLHGSPDALSSYLSSPSLNSLSIGDILYLSEYPLLRNFYINDLQNSHKLVSVGSHICDEATKYLSKNQIMNKMHVVPCGIDYKNMTTEFYNENPSNALEIVFVGRLFWPKGITYALGAFYYIVNTLNYKKATLRIIGDGPLKNWVARFAKKNRLESNIVIHGKTNRSTLLHLLSNANCVILPSLYEGCPYALIEANTLGVPIVAFNFKWAQDFIFNGLNGYTSDPFNIEKLAENVIKSINLKRSIIHETAKKFDVQNVCSELYSLYGELI